VEAKRAEIEAFVTRNWWQIESEQMVVFLIDECHLCWGDLAGYVWGNRRGRAEVPIRNEKTSKHISVLGMPKRKKQLFSNIRQVTARILLIFLKRCVPNIPASKS